MNCQNEALKILVARIFFYTWFFLQSVFSICVLTWSLLPLNTWQENPEKAQHHNEGICPLSVMGLWVYMCLCACDSVSVCVCLR